MIVSAMVMRSCIFASLRMPGRSNPKPPAKRLLTRLHRAALIGVSALNLKRTLEIGSYQTAWTMLHRLRSVLVRAGRDRLAGIVEVDETYIGGRNLAGVVAERKGRRS